VLQHTFTFLATGFAFTAIAGMLTAGAGALQETITGRCN
jgi:hypothetical protein